LYIYIHVMDIYICTYPLRIYKRENGKKDTITYVRTVRYKHIIYTYAYVNTKIYRYIWIHITYTYTCVHMYIYIYICISVYTQNVSLQSGEDYSCWSFSTIEPLNKGQFCGKWPIKISDPMSFRHPLPWGGWKWWHLHLCLHVYMNMSGISRTKVS